MSFKLVLHLYDMYVDDALGQYLRDMPLFKGIGVWINHGRLRKAKEYDIRENRSENKVSCYMQCEGDEVRTHVRKMT